MADYQPINDLGVVQIQTTEDYTISDPGLAGVAYLNGAANEGIQSYVTLDAVANDYPIGTYLYNAAKGYFNNPESPLFMVLNYAAGGAATTSPAANATNAANTTGTTTGTATGTATNATGNATNTTGGATNPPAVSAPSTADIASAIHAVKKYFGAPFEHLVIHVTDANKALAIEVAKFVEAQNNKLVYLEVPAAAPTATTGPDFSWLAPLVGSQSNRGAISTTVQSLPEATASDNDFNLDGAFLSDFANTTPGSNPQFTTGLEEFANVKPQDFYNFTRDDLDKYYTPYNVWTYAYRNGVPMFTTNYSLAGYQITPMLIRDAILKEVKANILNLFIQNKGIQYNQAGISMITDQITLVLDTFAKSGLITNIKVDKIDVDKITEATKATGHLSGLGWTWEPVFGINDAKFHQSIELPELH